MHTIEMTKAALVNKNICYAKKLARRFYNKRAHTHAELDDLESAAYLGLCEAASRYDSSKDNKFETYSYLRIVGAMYDYLVTNGGSSRSTYKMLEGSCELSKVPILRVARDLRELSRAQSLIEEWGIRVEVNLRKGSIDLLYANSKLADEEVEDRQRCEKLYAALSQLSPTICKLLTARYLEGKKLNEIAKDYPEYSKSHVSRLCSKGLIELRKKLKVNLQ